MNAQAGRDCFVTMFLAMTGAVLRLLRHDVPRNDGRCMEIAVSFAAAPGENR